MGWRGKGEGWRVVRAVGREGGRKGGERGGGEGGRGIGREEDGERRERERGR